MPCRVELVRGRVVYVVERGYERELLSSEFPLEDADVAPRMVRFTLRRDAPEVVPLVTKSARPAHDVEVQEIGRHDVAVGDERSSEEIGRAPAEVDDQRGRESHPLVLGEEQRAATLGREQRHQDAEVSRRLSRQGVTADRL